MKNSRFLGVGIIAVGFLLLCIAYRSTDADGDPFGAMLGNYAASTVWFIISGLIACIVGALLLVLGPRIPE